MLPAAAQVQVPEEPNTSVPVPSPSSVSDELAVEVPSRPVSVTLVSHVPNSGTLLRSVTVRVLLSHGLDELCEIDVVIKAGLMNKGSASPASGAMVLSTESKAVDPFTREFE